MPGPLTVPVGELETLGIGKESTPFVFASPTLFHAFTTFDPKPKNETVPRTGTRKRYGQTFPATGAFAGDASLEVESDPDTLGQLLAYAMGAQSAPSTTIYSGTLASAFNSGGNTASLNNVDNLAIGSTVTFNGGTPETLVVASITGNGPPYSVTFTTNAANTHAISSTCTQVSASAFASKMTLSTVPTFSVQLNRVTDAVDYIGCIIDSMSLTINPKAGLVPKFNLGYATEANDASPTAPTFSTKFPFTFEHPYNLQTLGVASTVGGQMIGQSGQVSTLGMSLTLNNNIDKSYYSGANGRKIQNWPQQQRSVKGSVTLGFETNTAYQDFLGTSGASATINGIAIPGLCFTWVMCNASIADGTLGIPYMISFKLPNLFANSHAISNKSTGVLQQTLDFDAAESGNGNQDDLTILYVGTNASVF